MPSPSVFLSLKSLVRGINSRWSRDYNDTMFFFNRFPWGRAAPPKSKFAKKNLAVDTMRPGQAVFSARRPLRCGRSAGIPDSKTFAVRTDQLSCPCSAVHNSGGLFAPGRRRVARLLHFGNFGPQTPSLRCSLHSSRYFFLRLDAGGVSEKSSTENSDVPIGD